MARKPQRRTQITHDRILDAARRLLSATPGGMEDLRAEEIAKEADVAKGTVFAHFGDMDGLFSHLLLDELALLRARADDDDDPAGILAPGPVGALLDRMMALVELITQNQTVLRIFMENIGVTKGHCARDFVGHLEALDRNLALLLEHWQGAEDLDPPLRQDRSPAEMVDGLIAFLLYGAILFRSGQVVDLASVRRRLERHVEAFLIAGHKRTA